PSWQVSRLRGSTLDIAGYAEPCLRRSRVLSALFAAGRLADPQLAPENALTKRQARERYEAAAKYRAMHFAAEKTHRLEKMSNSGAVIARCTHRTYQSQRRASRAIRQPCSCTNREAAYCRRAPRSAS